MNGTICTGFTLFWTVTSGRLLRIWQWSFWFCNFFLLATKKNTIYKLMWWLYKVHNNTMYYYGVIGHSSSNVTSLPYKSNGQHLFNILLFTDCSSGSNSGLGWVSRFIWCYWFYHGWLHVRDVEVCMYSMFCKMIAFLDYLRTTSM
jgi:hypothetical protein